MSDPTPLPPLARLLARLIPAADRNAIIGDLLEDADWRGLSGSRLSLALCTSCGGIAAGLAIERVRAGFAMPPAGELVAGLVGEGGRSLRAIRLTPTALLTRALVFLAAVGLLACSVEVLVAALMAAGGLRP